MVDSGVNNGAGGRYVTRGMASAQILVVEDNEMQSKLVSFLLEEAGYSVLAAESAENALQLLQSFRPRPILPDLILMDLQLPGKDGLELTRELRRNPTFDATPIIALTAYSDPSELAKAREAGCNGDISKPIDTTTFARQVREYLGGPTEADTEATQDSCDLLTELRNNFLAEGLEQSGTILKELQSDPAAAIEALRRVAHRWAGLGGTLGFPEISSQAREVEAVLIPGNTPGKPDCAEIAKAVETTRRRFGVAARNKPALPLEVITGLREVRIGLVDFSEEEANRIRSAANSAQVQVVIERMESNSIENQTACGALIVNECALSSQGVRDQPQWSVPAVFVGSRSSLLAFSRLPARAYDFLIAPWDAEEVLVRVYRLIANAAPQPAGELPVMQKRRPRVLVADDDPAIVSIVSEVLRQSEMDCDVARSGKQALDAAHRHPPDAMVLDVNMLDLDGFEVLKSLRNNLVTKEIPVLLLTARRDKVDITEGFNSGADDYVVKPFKPLDLAGRVSKMISARRKPLIPNSGPRD
jgi:two-component system cell cycle response regulator DivK